MKKFLAIVVLGLLFSGNAYASKMKITKGTQTQKKVGDWTIVKAKATQKFLSKKTFAILVFYVNKNDSKNCARITETNLYSDRKRLDLIAKFQKVINCSSGTEVQGRSVFYNNILQNKKLFKILTANKLASDLNYIPDKDNIIAEVYNIEIANDQIIAVFIQKINLHEKESLLQNIKAEFKFLIKNYPELPIDDKSLEEVIEDINSDPEGLLKILFPSYDKDIGKVQFSIAKFRTPKREAVIDYTFSSNTYDDFKNIINEIKTNFENLENEEFEVLINERDKNYIIDTYKEGTGIFGIQLRK